MNLTDRQITAIARTVRFKYQQWAYTLGGLQHESALKHIPKIELVEDMLHMVQINFIEDDYAEKTVTTIVEEFKSKSNTNNKHELRLVENQKEGVNYYV